MILAPLRWLGDHGTRLVAASIFIGLALPDLAAYVRPLFPLSVACMLTIAMIRVDPTLARGYLRRPALLVAGTAWMTVVTPCLIALAFLVYPPSAPIALGLIFWSTAPATVSSPAFAALLGLNGTLSLAFLLVAMISAPIIVPGLTEFLLDARIDVSTFGLMLRMGLLIGGCAGIAYVIRRLMGERRTREAGTVFDGLNVILMTLFAIAAMDGVTTTMMSDPWHVIRLIVLTAALSVGCIAAATLMFWKAGPVPAATFGFSNGNRNMALVLTALGGNVHPETWLFFAVAQFPIYLLPLLLQPVYDRIVRRDTSASAA